MRIYGADNTNIWDKGFVVKVLLILAFIVEMLAYILIMQSATAFRAVAQSIHFASLFLAFSGEKYIYDYREQNLLRNLKRRRLFFLVLLVLNCAASIGSTLSQEFNLLFAIPALVVATLLAVYTCKWTRDRIKRELEEQAGRELEENTKREIE